LSIVLVWSALILVPTHLAVELYHGLIFRQHVATANLVLATVNGLWAWPAVALAAALPAARSTQTVYACWLAGSLLAALAALRASGAFAPAASGPVDRRPRFSIDRACLVVYAGQLALFTMLFGDRLVLSLVLPAEQVGQFVLFWSFGYGVQTVTHGFVASSLIAPLARAEQRADRRAFGRLLLLALVRTGFTAGCGLTMVFIFWASLGEAVLGTAAHLPPSYLICLFAGFWLRSLADVLHVALVVRHADRELASSYAWAIAPALLLAGFAGQELDAAGAYLAVLGSSLLTLALLAWRLRVVWRRR
jgi:hypothetical protein